MATSVAVGLFEAVEGAVIVIIVSVVVEVGRRTAGGGRRSGHRPSHQVAG